MPHIARERYSELVDAKLRATIVKRVGVICNNRYEGSPKAGAVKVPVRDTEVTVADYNKKTGTAMTHGDTSFLTVNIDKDKAVNELIDGFDAESVPGQRRLLAGPADGDRRFCRAGNRRHRHGQHCCPDQGQHL